MEKRVILLILDGWGNGKPYNGNAINMAHKPNFDRLIAHYPNSDLHTCGEWVGLPDGQMGNSEVGHMNIGAGRVVYQQLVLINKAFREGMVNTNEVLLKAVATAKATNKKVHLIGLVSDGGVHSSIDHVKGLCHFLQNQGLSTFYVHAFTDGRDTDPKGGVQYLTDLNETLIHTGGKIASVTGRYYAMDRDKRWERVKLAYDAMVHATGEGSSNVIETIKSRYAANETDEFLKPIIALGSDQKPLATIEEGDIVINFNFRTDRGREITMALTQQDFAEQDMKALNLHYVTLTEYDKTFKNVSVVFPDIELKHTLGEVLESHNKKQVRIAETEKYPHVTFFFSGGQEVAFKGETRHMAPSPKVATYDLQPEMSAEQVCGFTLEEIAKNEADFMVVNFANPDMVGHTGVIPAEIKAIEKVDECLGRVVEAALKNNYSLLVTADHGNGEYMINEEDGTPNTAHTTNDVPLLLIEPQIGSGIKSGKLADLAPTTLALMGIPQPKEMDGVSLLS
ncbi:MAG: phosphoglycerate mutase (2,3-diphosphoglycerate-independent) [Bacteroidetes bacterium B1(2017)]|nr:MAG: phosphoglycerate mutase (2,3-diphosphoglycerate-independent) [Bacteroidetes bacterium B1(2017)]